MSPQQMLFRTATGIQTKGKEVFRVTEEAAK